VETTGLSAAYPDDGGLFLQAASEGDSIADAYENCDYNRAMRQIMALADRANQFVDAKAPWTLRKDPAKARETQDVCSIALNLFRQIAIYLAPVLPQSAQRAGELLNDPITSWEQSKKPLVSTKVTPFQPMLTRVDPAQVQAMIDDSREASPVATSTAAPAAVDGPEALQAEPLAPECSIDDFTKVDLRVARILSAEEVPDARKLLKLTLSLGGDVRKSVFAGIKKAYKPEDLVGRLVICVANLAPRQMKFGLSEGMVAAAGSGGDEVFLLSPDSGAKPGQRVH
jgi:methionyl-tRNA synthetase